MKIYKFIKTSILFICTLSISTHCLSQSTDSDQSNGKEINRIHYLSIPYQLVFNVKSWRGGLQLSLGSPVLEVEINRDANASGRLGPRDRNSLGTNISTNWGFDVGAFVGKTIHLPNEDYFFIEGQFTGFNYIQPNRSNDSFRLKGTFPYWIVLKIGKGF